MANLGAIGRNRGGLNKITVISRGAVVPRRMTGHYHRPLAWYSSYSGQQLLNVDTLGNISGVVNAPQNVRTRCRIFLVSKTSARVIASAYAKQDGSFSFTNLDRSSADYFAVCSVPGDYNAQVFDKLQPV